VYLGLNALHISIDSIYLKIFHDDTSVGLLNAALRILTPLAVFPTIVALSAAPYLARASMAADSGERTRQLFTLGLKTLVVGAVLLALFGAANARTLIYLAFKQEYAQAGLPMIILFITFLPMSLNMFLVEVNNARNMLTRNTVLATIFAGVSVMIGPLLIIPYDVPGAAAAKLLAVLAGMAYLLPATRRELQVPLCPILCKALALIAALLLTWYLTEGMHVVAANAIGLAVFAACVFLLRFFSQEELLQWKTQIAGLFGRAR
jgi:O-antigen/teichoic acid export membrane protein